jgi:hypothetical protein
MNDSNNYYECPRVYSDTGDHFSVFLAGGITGCPNWQEYAKNKLLETCDGLVILNPRRATFDVTDKNASHEQIKWEFDALRKASIVLFWFPHSETSVCPIALYELGVFAQRQQFGKSAIMVGCDPCYARREDVKIQLSLLSKEDVTIHSSLDALLGDVEKWYSPWKGKLGRQA